MKALIKSTALTATLLLTHGVFAENSQLTPTTQAEISPEKLALARQVVQLLDYQKDWENELQLGLEQNKKYEDPSDAKSLVSLVQYSKSVNITEPMAKIYANLYTTNELRYLLNFYSTPDGKAISKKNKQLTAQYEQLKMTILMNVTLIDPQ